MNEQTIEKSRATRPTRIAKKVLSVAAKILIELIEQQLDLNYVYFHGASLGRSVRDSRYAHE